MQSGSQTGALATIFNLIIYLSVTHLQEPA